MKVPTYIKPTIDETGKLPKGVEILGNSQSNQIETLTTTLQQNCSFEDQFNSETVVYTASDQEDVFIYLKTLKGKPLKVEVIGTNHYSPWSYCWAVVDQTTVRVKVKWSSPPSTPMEITVRVFGG